MEFIYYPKCSTCIRAKKYLLENGVEFVERNIVDNTPTKDELISIISKSNTEIKKFFNTSGKVYKEKNLKDVVKDVTLEEAAELLSSNGMLIKRPILINGDNIVVGFKEESYNNLINKEK